VQRQRVISFIDGFNLYHAISSLHRPELQWVNLHSLSKVFLKSHSEELCKVFYFSAYAEHVTVVKQKSQKSYLQALELTGVEAVLGQFKEKVKRCPVCHSKWMGHEEKETDVNLALFVLNLAYLDAFDRALIISNDSDLTPAIRMVRNQFPRKRITTVAPPNLYHSRELMQAASDKTKIRVEHLERSVLPLVVANQSGLVWVSRPQEYMSRSVVHSAPG